jgi:uncharacterized protein with HEPN domain
MKHPERLEDYLEHISEAIERAMEYLHPIDMFEAFKQRRRDQDAIIRNIEIIGEAARKIQKLAPEFLKAHSEVPWSYMRGIRDKVIHEYFDVDLTVIWGTVKDDMPKLKQQIDGLLIDLKRDPDRER